jgi:hypothetical protein
MSRQLLMRMADQKESYFLKMELGMLEEVCIIKILPEFYSYLLSWAFSDHPCNSIKPNFISKVLFLHLPREILARNNQTRPVAGNCVRNGLFSNRLLLYDNLLESANVLLDRGVGRI